MSVSAYLRVAPGLAQKLIDSVQLANLSELIEVIVVGKSGEELSPAEVAREFDVSPATVRRWEAKEWLKPTRRMLGSGYRRYSRIDVEAFKQRIAAGEFEGLTAPVAANRARATPQRDTSPGKGSPPSEVDGAPMDPPSEKPAGHRQPAKKAARRRPRTDG